MPKISSYTQYLPPVLWSKTHDPEQHLGRKLRVFEKILHGFNFSGEVARAFAPITSAAVDRINLANVDDASAFRVGDVVTIVGSAERRMIQNIDREIGQLILSSNLAVAFGIGTVRIADLEVGQSTFRIASDSNIGNDDRVQLTQVGTSEVVTIESTDNDFITIKFGLNFDYPLGDDQVRVQLSDGNPLDRNNEVDPAIDQILKKLHLISNPWKTEATWLPWLASWVALEPEADWDEYQTRQLIASMVDIYRHRGLHHGLHTYLDIFALKNARPRITIDDGSAVLKAKLGSEINPFSLVQSNTVPLTTSTHSVLLHPTGIESDLLNQYIIADEGDSSLSTPREPALWRVNSNGEVNYNSSATVPLPDPIHSGAPLVTPRAVTVDSSNRYSVINQSSYADFFTPVCEIYRFAPPAYGISTVISAPALPVVNPVDMILDDLENYIVLDRGGNVFGDPPFGPSVPKIVVVSEGPLSVSEHALATVTEPSAMAIDSVGRFIIADVRDHNGTQAADLVRIDPSDGWSETSLLFGAPSSDPNPLTTPTGIVMEDDDHILIVDSGLRWGYDSADPEGADPAYRYVAKDPAFCRVDLTTTPPRIEKVSSKKRLVHPTKIKLDQNGDVIISDRGDKQQSLPGRNWRAGTNEFGLTVHFSRDTSSTFEERNRLRRGIERVANKAKPSHSEWWMDF